MSRLNSIAMILVALALAVTAGKAQAQQFTGVFTSPWYSPHRDNDTTTNLCSGDAVIPVLKSEYCSEYHSDHVPTGGSILNHAGVTNVALWQKEILDMQRAGLQFFAPYSFGSQVGFWADPAVFGPTMSQAIANSGTTVRMAYFHDTQGEVVRQFRADHPPPAVHCPVPPEPQPAGCIPVLAFQLGRGVSHWRTHIYEQNIKRYFDSVPATAQFRPEINRPVMFFYNTAPHWTDRQFLGDVLEQIRAWMALDYPGINPIILVEAEWLTNQPQATVDKILAQSDATFVWGFYPTPGTRGATTAGAFPGGGIVSTHQRTGLTVGSAGVGYRYTVGGLRNRERRNGLTLFEDWNLISGATLRMVAAWYDYEEDSGISRTKEYQYEYIDLVKRLIVPVAPTVATVGSDAFGTPLRGSVASLMVVKGVNFLPGAMLLVLFNDAVVEVPMIYISGTELHQWYGGGPSGSFPCAVKNPGVGGQPLSRRTS